MRFYSPRNRRPDGEHRVMLSGHQLLPFDKTRDMFARFHLGGRFYGV
jgi:hypothetical protein